MPLRAAAIWHCNDRLLSGRLLEVTNGRFVDAKREKPRLSIGQVWGKPTGGFGLGCGQLHELTASKPSSALMLRVSSHSLSMNPAIGGCSRMAV
jgi:hypothetical protein